MDDRQTVFPGLQNALDTESLILKCVHELYQDTDAAEAAGKMLERLGRYLGADRAYLFDIRGDHLVNTFEWCAPGVSPELENQRHVDARTIARWEDSFARGECVIIEDVEDVRDVAPVEYRVLSKQNVRSLAAAPLERDGEVVGFLGIDNPPSEKIRNIASPLKTLCYFYLMTVQRIENEERLRALSYRDELTGLNNRNRYIADVERLHERGGSLGVIFLDVNDLKVINDRQGHCRGDEVLCSCAKSMVASLPGADVYRIGGDEFVALVSDATREEFEGMVASLRQAFGLREGVLDRFVSVGARWSCDAGEARELIAEADAEMYRKKRAFHLDKALAGVMPHEGSADEGGLEGDDPSYLVPLHASRSALLREYNMLLGVLGIGVVKYRLNDGFTIVWANDRFHELTGCTREECGKTDGAVVESLFAEDPDEFARLRGLVNDAYRAGGRFDGIVRMLRRAGGPLWIRVAGTCTNERIEGSPVVYSTLTDVTDLLEGRLEGWGGPEGGRRSEIS